MGGYTYSEADIVRVAIKKKDESILEKEKESFIKRSVSLGHNPNVSNSVYNMILKFFEIICRKYFLKNCNNSGIICYNSIRGYGTDNH